MSEETHSLAIFPAQIAFEGLRLQDGSVLSVAVDRPATVFLVAHRTGTEIEIISRFDTQAEAVEATKRLVDAVDTMAASGSGRAH
ncbi:hypothetical protein [Aquamicrobium ahrensii]|uniref:Uncharacterized protein n=1 Tax=Aquamicrobium ahrensii TaxID=469551 RepID=A0ABV2KFW8_9HYPH